MPPSRLHTLRARIIGPANGPGLAGGSSTMSRAANPVWLVFLLGIVSTTQTHLAKALERQGIETWELLRACFWRSEPDSGASLDSESSLRRKRLRHQPLICIIGLVLNHTTFLYHLLIALLGATVDLYTGMYGMGLVALLLYTAWVMKEAITRLQVAGAASILAGTLVIGLEVTVRPSLDMAQMSLPADVAAVLLLLGVCLAVVVAGLRNGKPHLIGLAFGLAAGVLEPSTSVSKVWARLPARVDAFSGARRAAGRSWPLLSSSVRWPSCLASGASIGAPGPAPSCRSTTAPTSLSPSCSRPSCCPATASSGRLCWARA